jgi:hypothetical protein
MVWIEILTSSLCSFVDRAIDFDRVEPAWGGLRRTSANTIKAQYIDIAIEYAVAAEQWRMRAEGATLQFLLLRSASSCL